MGAMPHPTLLSRPQRSQLAAPSSLASKPVDGSHLASCSTVLRSLLPFLECRFSFSCGFYPYACQEASSGARWPERPSPYRASSYVISAASRLIGTYFQLPPSPYAYTS